MTRSLLTIYFFFCLVMLPNTFASPTRSSCPRDQRDALLKVQKEFHVPTTSWNKSIDCCSWNGVTCDTILGEVISLKLSSFNITTNTSLKSSSALFKLRHLRTLDLKDCRLQGEIPSSIGNLSHLITSLDLSDNNFVGRVPRSISKLVNLEVLVLSHNNFRGRVPRSISKVVNLRYIDLSYNNFKGQVPPLPSLRRSLYFSQVKLSYNSFSSFEEPMEVIDGASVLELNLGSNSLQGPFPQWICKLKNLAILDLSNNHFTGSIPQCLNSFRFEELSLKNNNLSGFIPDFIISGCTLQSLDVSGNNLVGKLPKSLINCPYMEFLNVKGNKIKDTFPFWLGSSLSLKVLMLGSNAFYGPVYNSSTYFGFSRLRIIDISNNNFVGSLPQDYFANWTAMSVVFQNGFNDPTMNYLKSDFSVYRSIDLAYKGVDTDVDRIFLDLKVIDFSRNRFSGHIPESIGLMSELRLLNLSGNTFTGNIPSSLANITELEALDLSRNNLSGEIPQSLGKLSKLAYINVSHNHLEGLVPRSTQFGTQNCFSFVGNPGLYGLEEICKESHRVPVPTSQQPEESLSESKEHVLNWIIAAIAFGPGVFCGLVIGHIFTSYKHEWFITR